MCWWSTGAGPRSDLPPRHGGVPGAPDGAQERGIDDEVAEGRDHGHVDAAQQATRLDVDGEASRVVAVLVLDPGELEDAVHRGVGELRRVLVGGVVQGDEAEAGRAVGRMRRRVAKVRGQAIAQCLRVACVVPVEDLSDAQAQAEERARCRGLRGGDVVVRRDVDERGEVVAPAAHR